MLMQLAKSLLPKAAREYYHRNTGFRKYLDNTLWLLFEKLLRIGVAVLIGAWVARYLGPSQFGLLSFAQSLVALFGSVAALGITNILVKDLVNGDIHKPSLLSTALVLMMAGACISFLALAAYIYFFGYGADSNTIILVIGCGILFQASGIIECYFQSEVKARFIVLSSISSLLISSVVKLALIYLKASLLTFSYAIVFDALTLLMGYVYFFKRDANGQHFKFDFSFTLATNLLRESYPYILSGLLITIYMRIDQVMIKQMMGDYAVGQYSVAVALSGGWYFLPMTIVASLYPAIVNSKKVDNAIYLGRLSRLYSFLIYTSLILSVLIGFCSNWVVALLYGHTYQQAGSVLMVHIWASVFVSIGVASGRWLLTEGLQKYGAINTLIGAVLNVGLNLILIPRFGIIGVAWATLIAQACTAYFCLLLWEKTRPSFFAISRSVLTLPSLR